MAALVAAGLLAAAAQSLAAPVTGGLPGASPVGNVTSVAQANASVQGTPGNPGGAGPLAGAATAPRAGASAAAGRVASFPRGAQPLTDLELTRRLNNRVFDAELADGSTWRVEYLSNGRFFLETNRGEGGKGLWQAEAGRLCNQLIGQARQCLEVRVLKDTLHLRRSDSEIVRLIAQ